MPLMSYDEVLDLMVKEMHDLDGVLSRHLDRMEKTDSIGCRSCKSPDPGCCYQKVMVYVDEVLPIARLLKQQGRDTPEFRERLRVTGEEMEGTNNDDWFHRDRRPCVFLSEGRCSIYDVRPHACRSYYVVNEPHLCQPGETAGVWKVDTMRIAELFTDRSRTVQHALGLPSSTKRLYLGSLPRLVLLALIAQEQPSHERFLRVFKRETRWPTFEQLDNWFGGRNPFGDKLYRIRKKTAQ